MLGWVDLFVLRIHTDIFIIFLDPTGGELETRVCLIVICSPYVASRCHPLSFRVWLSLFSKHFFINLHCCFRFTFGTSITPLEESGFTSNPITFLTYHFMWGYWVFCHESKPIRRLWKPLVHAGVDSLMQWNTICYILFNQRFWVRQEINYIGRSSISHLEEDNRDQDQTIHWLLCCHIDIGVREWRKLRWTNWLRSFSCDTALPLFLFTPKINSLRSHFTLDGKWKVGGNWVEEVGGCCSSLGKGRAEKVLDGEQGLSRVIGEKIKKRWKK